MTTKLQIMGMEKFRKEVCVSCGDRCDCDEEEQDMENCFENISLRDCRG
jgi:hypothetical protein